MRLLVLSSAVAATAVTGGLLSAAPASGVAPEPVEVRPERTISVPAAGPVHLSAAGRSYTLDFQGRAIVVYGAKARGKARPLYRIRGSRSGIFWPMGIARDAGGRLYVANGNQRVLVFSASARGNARPIRVLRTGMYIGAGIAVRGERLMVSGGAGIAIYRRTASGDAAPLRRIAGEKAQLRGLLDADMNVDGRIWAVFGEGAFATVFAPGARGDVAPERTITQDRPLWDVESVGFDRAGRAYIGQHDGEVTVLRHDAKGQATPVLSLARTPLGGIGGLSVSRTGKLAVTSGSSITVYPRLLAATRPWAVRSVTVSGSPAAVRRVVRWKKPLADGGAPLTRYRVSVRHGSRLVTTAVLKASRRSYVLERRSLPAGTSTVVVRAKNRKGYGPAVRVTLTVRK
ncbi:hypothetical protein [Mumia sp. DW29H23]|uniref:hypothetical protein n=1 Tax=Mumia sp. DW29H23 TaxID=3421241 RepID=UPI003D680782